MCVVDSPQCAMLMDKNVEDQNDSSTALENHIALLPFLLKRCLLRAFNSVIPIFFVVIAVFLSSASRAQSPVENELGYPIKAAFLYKFCLYVEWPPTTFHDTGSPIVLGIAGPDVIVDELNAAVMNRTINNRRLEVHRINEDSDLLDMHVLFIARSETALLKKTVTKLKNTPLLLVTEIADGLDEGAGINFIVKDNKVRFDVALDTTTRQGLHLSAQLLKVARNVRGENSR